MANRKRINTVLKYSINGLARHFYSMMGYNVEEGYDFSKAIHPTEKLMWQMALDSYGFWNGD